MLNFKPWLWWEVQLFELQILDTIAHHCSIQKWLSSKDRVGSREDVTSSNQDIKTNVATLVYRRGVQGSCFILHRVFLSMLALVKIMPSSRCVVSWLDDVTRRPLIQIIVGLPFGDLSNGGHVFDKVTWAISSQEQHILIQIYKFIFFWSNIRCSLV